MLLVLKCIFVGVIIIVSEQNCMERVQCAACNAVIAAMAMGQSHSPKRVEASVHVH